METDPIQQIAIFRVPELQACLTQLRLSKAGLKKDLQTRLANHLRELITPAQHASATDGVRRREEDAGEVELSSQYSQHVCQKANMHVCSSVPFLPGREALRSKPGPVPCRERLEMAHEFMCMQLALSAGYIVE